MKTEDDLESGQMQLDPAAARQIVELLQLLTELPSTPAIVAEDRGIAALIELIDTQLPMPHASQEWERARPPPQAMVTLDADTVLVVIELLDLFAQLPSTPPALTADAQQLSARIRLRHDA